MPILECSHTFDLRIYSKIISRGMIPLSSNPRTPHYLPAADFEIFASHYPFLTTARSGFGEPREQLLTYGRDDFILILLFDHF